MNNGENNSDEILVDRQEQEKISTFSQHLESIGVFPRDYDQESLKKLYLAVKEIYGHLCKLDSHYYSTASKVKLISLANAYSDCHADLRKLE